MTLIWVTAFAQEVSVFGAGNIASNNPYGLTENEQILLDSKKRVDQVISKQQSQEEEMIGLRSVVEGSQNQVSKLESRVSDLEIRTTGKVSNLASPNAAVATGSDIQSLKDEIVDLKRQIEAINQKLGIQGSVKKNSKPVAKTETKQPLIAVDKTPPAPVKSEKADQKPSKLAETKKAGETTTQKPSPKKVLGFDDMKPADIEKDAKALFDAKKYQDAKIHYDYLSNKKYNLAKTQFMLGEIAFNQKSYANAIQNYQASLKADDKAEYLPELLHRSGISLENLGDKANADKFYNYLKTKYPDSPQAKSIK